MTQAPAIATQAVPLPALAGHPLLLFDGNCVLCHRSVTFLLRHDRACLLRFAPLSSPLGASILARHPQIAAQLTPGKSGPSSVVFVTSPGQPQERLQLRSGAVLATLALLPAPWPAVAALARAIPRPVRDLAYRLVARLRYRLFGRMASCPLPPPAERDRLLTGQLPGLAS